MGEKSLGRGMEVGPREKKKKGGERGKRARELPEGWEWVYKLNPRLNKGEKLKVLPEEVERHSHPSTLAVLLWEEMEISTQRIIER